MNKIFLFLFLFSNISVFASSKALEKIENFDIRYYQPQNFGLKDLSFEIRVTNLKKIILNKVQFEKLKDVYYQVYWMSPGKYKLEVVGLPDGFEELKSEMKELVKNRLDYVIPRKLSQKLRAYSFTGKSISGGSYALTGIDKTHMRSINEIRLVFDKEGKLEKYSSKSPMGSKSSSLNMSTKSWSKNKWVIDSIEAKSALGLQITTINTEIKYNSVNGFGFPSNIKITTTQELTMPTEKKSKKTIESEIIFSNYKVNSGMAASKIMEKSGK